MRQVGASVRRQLGTGMPYVLLKEALRDGRTGGSEPGGPSATSRKPYAPRRSAKGPGSWGVGISAPGAGARAARPCGSIRQSGRRFPSCRAASSAIRKTASAWPCFCPNIPSGIRHGEEPLAYRRDALSSLANPDDLRSLPPFKRATGARMNRSSIAGFKRTIGSGGARFKRLIKIRSHRRH
jgi:hypothetical protein